MTEWRSVVGYEGLYEVSAAGEVKSTRSGAHLSTHPERKAQYPTVRLSNKGVVRKWFVHRLVAYAFLGPRPEGLDIRHRNGDATDCRVANLAYGTRSRNIQDSVEHGTHGQARKTHCKQGHEFTPQNTRLRRSGTGRCCRACGRDRMYQARRRGQL
jgi:hypothetical protein